LNCRPQWLWGLRRKSAAARLLRLWVGIPPGAWMYVCCDCCVLSGSGLCDELITRPEEFYWLWCVIVCDLETSWMRRYWPTGGCCAKKKKYWTIWLYFRECQGHTTCMTCRCRNRGETEVQAQPIRHPALQGRRYRCFTSEKEAVTFVQEAVCGLGSSRSHGKSFPTGFRSPKPRAHSDSPYRTRYFGCHIL
jgi:hypothetical protein